MIEGRQSRDWSLELRFHNSVSKLIETVILRESLKNRREIRVKESRTSSVRDESEMIGRWE